MSEIVFRLARPSEREALEALQRRASLNVEEDREALLEHPDAIDLPLEHIASGRTIVAELDGVVVGFAVVLPRDDGDAELDGLFVEPISWRRGIGRGLVERIERMAATAGAAHLCVVANTSALQFYGACGFETVGQAQTRFRAAPRMRKSLSR
jgi:GNAT superfamily N-acetyltransferase